MEFKIAKLDKRATIISIFTAALLGFLAIFFALQKPHQSLFLIITILIVVISYLLSPKRYFLDGSRLIIEKVIGTTTVISLADIEGYVFVPDLMKINISRAFGNGGLFGYYGYFSSAEYGNINCQLRSLKNVFIVKSKKGTFAISPLEPEKFENYFKTMASGISTQIEQLIPINPETIKRATAWVLIIPAVIFALTIIMVFSLYPHLPERIVTHFNGRGMPDGWGNKDSFMLFSIISGFLLLILNLAIFFIFRQTSADQKLPNYWVMILAFVQAFVAIVFFDLYSFNMYRRHFLPFEYLLIGFFVILTAALLFYYQRVKHQKTTVR